MMQKILEGPQCEENMKFIKQFTFIFWNFIFVDKEAQCHQDDSFPQINQQTQGNSNNFPVRIRITPKEFILKLI